MEQKPAPWARVIGATVAFVADNIWMLIVIIAAIIGDSVLVLMGIVMAFYTRLTEIRDNIGISLTLKVADNEGRITKEVTL